MAAYIAEVRPAGIDRRRLMALGIFIRRWTRRLVSLRLAASGNSAIALALAAPILVGWLVPVADRGMVSSRQTEPQQVVRTDAQYMYRHADNSPAIVDTITARTPAARP